MNNSIYRRLKDKAVKTSEKLGAPSFYEAFRKELDISRFSFSVSDAIRRCRSCLDEANLHPAHGFIHLEKVAVEAGALVQTESENYGSHVRDTGELMLCAQIAGLLHDITRNGKDHAVTGSIEAALILRDFDISEAGKRYIIAAIRNHEAFKSVLASDEEACRLVCDSLYDADKFRWGPDNFTTTLWLITESSGMPAETLYCVFRKKMEVIARIGDTFRTETGRKYGPEFINMGMEIGNVIYRELGKILGD
ncbi:MAG: hypothetical protein P8013_01720 [Candidatus Sulfobium sp.]